MINFDKIFHAISIKIYFYLDKLIGNLKQHLFIVGRQLPLNTVVLLGFSYAILNSSRFKI